VLAALVLGVLFLRHGALVDTRAAAAGAAPLPSVEPVADAAACEASVAAEDWTVAIPICSELYARDPDYPGLADDLATAYVRQGQQRLAQGDDLAAAGADFEDALGYQPGSEEAQAAWQNLYSYLQGDQALGAGDWETAVDELSADYARAPDYLQSLGERSLEARLFAAWLGWGQAALAADDLTEAAPRCEQALALVPADREAQRCVEAARGLANRVEAVDEALLTDDPEALTEDEAADGPGDAAYAAEERTLPQAPRAQSTTGAASGGRAGSTSRSSAPPRTSSAFGGGPWPPCCGWPAPEKNMPVPPGMSTARPTGLCAAIYQPARPPGFPTRSVTCFGGPEPPR
jgi:tetratricopeptide (TPR) repeat protein